MFKKLQAKYEKQQKFFGEDKFINAAKKAKLSDYDINLYKQLYQNAVSNYKNEAGFRYPVATFGIKAGVPNTDPFIQSLQRLMDKEFIYHFVEAPTHYVILNYFNFSLFDPEETDKAIQDFSIKILQDANVPMVVEKE